MRKLLTSTRVANVLAFLALLPALGGTSYAALTLPGTASEPAGPKPKAVTLSKISTSARKSLKGQTETRRTRRTRSRPRTGGAEQGPKGDTGLTGASGPVNVVIRIGTPTSVAANSSATASCGLRYGGDGDPQRFSPKSTSRSRPPARSP